MRDGLVMLAYHFLGFEMEARVIYITPTLWAGPEFQSGCGEFITVLQ